MCLHLPPGVASRPVVVLDLRASSAGLSGVRPWGCRVSCGDCRTSGVDPKRHLGRPDYPHPIQHPLHFLNGCIVFDAVSPPTDDRDIPSHVAQFRVDTIDRRGVVTVLPVPDFQGYTKYRVVRGHLDVLRYKIERYSQFLASDSDSIHYFFGPVGPIPLLLLYFCIGVTPVLSVQCCTLFPNLWPLIVLYTFGFHLWSLGVDLVLLVTTDLTNIVPRPKLDLGT